MPTAAPQSAAVFQPFRLLGEYARRLLWIAVLIGLVVIAAKYYGLDRLDEEIRARFEQQLREHYAGLQVHVRSARRIEGEGLEFRGVTIAEWGGPEAPVLVQIDEIFCACDVRFPEILTEKPRVTKLEIRRPRFRAERKPSGVWNVSHLLPLPKQGARPPRAEISGGVLEIVDPERSDGALTLRNIELTIEPQVLDPPQATSTTPSAATVADVLLQLRGAIAGDHFERIELEGVVDPASSAWQVRGGVEGLEFNSRLRSALPREISGLFEPLSAVRGRTHFAFQLERGPRTPENPAPSLTYSVYGKLAEARIDDARLPDPLTDVEASIRINNKGIWIDDLTAQMGPANLSLVAELRGHTADSPLSAHLRAGRLNLDRLSPEKLPPVLQQVWAKFSPQGVVDLDAKVTFDGESWTPDVLVRCRKVALEYERFRYRLTDGQGEIRLKDDQLSTRLTASGGGRIVVVKAEIRQPGPFYTGWIELQSDGGPLPIDENLVSALPPGAQTVVRAFHPRGGVSFHGSLLRDQGDAPPIRRLSVQLHDCSIQHDKFSYPIDHVNGSLHLDGDNWVFQNLTGRNDSAFIVGQGTWRPAAAEGDALALQFTASDVPLVDELRLALAPAARRLWENLRPRGVIDHLAVRLKYNPSSRKTTLELDGQKWPPDRNAEGRTLSVEPSWAPYRMDNLTGEFHYRNGVTTLQRIKAQHGRVQFEVEAEGRTLEDGGWVLDVSRLAADRLELDRELLGALPGGMGQGLAQLGLQGALNMQGKATVAAPAEMPVPQISWDMNFDIEGGRLPGEHPVEQIYGGVRVIGGYDGKSLTGRGELAIDSAIVRKVQVTQVRGPFRLDSQYLLLGAWAERDVTNRVPRQVTAQVLGGQIVLDAQLRLTAEGPFQMQAALENADLAQLMSDLSPRNQGLTGKAYALVRLTGTREGVHTYRGDGQIRLRDADIYELPLMIAMLKLVEFKRPNRTAFTTSDIDFRVEGDDLEFTRLEFKGDAVSLQGKGRMNGAREIDLKLYSRLGRDEYALLRPLQREASREFLLIEVTGPLDNPSVQRQAFPRLNETLQQLFPELAQQAVEPALPIIDLPRQALQRTLSPR